MGDGCIKKPIVLKNYMLMGHTTLLDPEFKQMVFERTMALMSFVSMDLSLAAMFGFTATEDSQTSSFLTRCCLQQTSSTRKIRSVVDPGLGDHPMSKSNFYNTYEMPTHHHHSNCNKFL